MIKITGSADFDFGEPAVQLVKMSSRGVIGADRTAFEKRAATALLLDIEHWREKVAKDEELIHLLAVGTTEDYGANRNGDGFKRATCRDYHDTFQKLAKFYRDHKNKNRSISYGRLIKSAYNDKMKRIELLVGLNTTPEAAKRNDGLVADKELEKLAAGKEIPVSMACKVAMDICSYCGNKAPTIADYCTGTHEGGHCKAGGLKNNIGRLVEIDGGVHQLHADNPAPQFFDISHVFRPADRIAYVTGSLEKAAAAGHVVKSAELARQLGVTAPADLIVTTTLSPRTQQLVKLAYMLADIEADIANGDIPSAAYAAGLGTSFEVPVEQPRDLRYKCAHALRALADRHICLPLSQFIAVFTDGDMEKAAETAAVVRRELPGMYTRLIATPDFVDTVSQSQFTPGPGANVDYQLWADKMAADFAVDVSSMRRRVNVAMLRQTQAGFANQLPLEKTAAAGTAIGDLAKNYAMYQLSFLGALPEYNPDLTLTARAVILQNHVK